jgi:probable F420-dependent oxidoreductase
MSTGLKIGLNIVPVRPEHLIDVCQAAEALGFESVWSGEHVAIPMRPDWFEGPEEAKHLTGPNPQAKRPFKPDTIFLDPMISLATIAASTSRLRLGIGIYMLALRDAVLVGRTIASLDVVSKGRLDLGVGLGWVSHEYAITNNDWATRGRRTDESIRCLRALFEEKTPSFAGEFFNFEPIGFEPKPVQTPLPIHIGGDGKLAVRRAASLGNGWIGGPHLFEPIRAELKRRGRDHEPFQFSAQGGAATCEQIDKLAAMGADRVVVAPWLNRRDTDAAGGPVGVLERYAKSIGLSPSRAPVS